MPRSAKSTASSRSVSERQLLRSRSVLLFGTIEPKHTREVVRQILVLDQISKTKPIRVYINSPGGAADDGFAIYDVLNFVSAPVSTIVTGLAASAATIVLLGAPKEQRLILPHSRVMVHQPSIGVRGTASDIAITAKEIIRLRKKANELFANETGRSVEQLEQDMQRDYWMSADEAVEYGLIHKVIRSSSELPE